MSPRHLGNCFATVAFACLFIAGVAAQERNTLVIAGESPYRPSAYPDRVVLVVTEDPSASQAVNWRTDTSVTEARAQITLADATAGLHLEAHTEQGITRVLEGSNGTAHHHSVIFRDLEPDTLYAYRVGGRGTWSEWFQFRTAGAAGAPFAFLYFGDAQNSVKSHFSRVLREANRELSRPALMLHAGDLINQRDGNHDDEWGEWFAAGGFLHAMSPTLPVTGNHEFLEESTADGSVHFELPDTWPAHFTLPANGPEGLQDTVYYSRYQGVLFVALDSTRALQDVELARAQARWLDTLLTGDSSDWVIISHHHPLFSTSSGRDNTVLREYWEPVYDKHGVDLVLQGHDHGYGRGDNLGSGRQRVAGESGTVYVVSVAGPKMSMVNAAAREEMSRVAEDTQLFQIIHITSESLRFEARTATNAIYDAFELMKNADGSKVLEDAIPTDQPERTCMNTNPPEASRCWNGTELVD